MKSILTQYIVLFAVLASVTIAISTLPSCNSPMDSKEWAKGNHCPYEGKECPNAQAAISDYLDSLIIYSNEVDELHERVAFLEGQLALYHNKYGSVGGNIKSTTLSVAKPGIIHLTRDDRGLISVVYREKDGKEYALDYITDEEFFDEMQRCP